MIEVYAEDAEEAIEAWQEIRGEECTWGGYSKFQIAGLKHFVESSLRLAVRWKLGVGWYQRSDGRQGYRNGTYRRTLVTPYGTVEIEVPRLREGSYEQGLFDRNGLLTKEARELILETYLAGPSTRRVGEVLERVLGYEVSAATVSAICKGLDELVRRYWSSQIEDKWEYLLLDAIVVRNRAVSRVEKRFVLVAMGVTSDGLAQVLSFKQAESEAEVCWQEFVDDLVRRGLEGENLKLVTTDGGPGLVSAVRTAWPRVPRQRCWVHKLRNIACKVKRRNQKACMDGARLIYMAKTRKDARNRFFAWRNRWIAEEPKAVACLEKDLEEMLEFLNLPEEHWAALRTTNRIERAFREVRRRIRTISCFTNRRSVDRMIYTIFAYENRKKEAHYLKRLFTHNT